MPVKSLLRYSLQASMRKLAETRPLAPQPADIDRFLSLCHRRRYPSKAPIIRPGDVANTLYYIIEGSLAVMTEDDEGRELILAYVNEGDYIGEMGLFMEVEKREVMVRSRVPCELAEISYERLFQLF
ncbi:MAG: cyclic nucleotide-binding domain-containing protein, partial [Xanthomonadales bacterium]|nr:cyclic nucleotide-binding domain-containing protein [Xanthomonadales bacterium]